VGPEDAIDFPDREAWRAWLDEHHASETDIWVVHHKKASTRQGLRYPDGVEEALAYGWIDSKMRRLDEETFAQRYSPRKPTSVWSRHNVERVERLIAEGRMTPAGMAVIEEAQRRGSWDEAYTAHEPPPLPDDLRDALEADGVAWDVFEGWAASYRLNYIHWVEDAKREETRRRRIAQVVERARKGLKPGE
jgi:uncharacterized protein YdeI (YjbR/CyaY-like superfamily)